MTSIAHFIIIVQRVQGIPLFCNAEQLVYHNANHPAYNEPFFVPYGDRPRQSI